MVWYTICPSCKKNVIRLGHVVKNQWQYTIVRPKGVSRSPLPPEVRPEFADDYREACLVLPDSTKASAALSRRCLQNLLRETTQINHSNLNDEIKQVLEMRLLPSYLADALDAVRVIGNFAAHPIKSTSTGVVVDVEPGEAEWSLDVIEGLFSFFFVEKGVLEKKRAALDAKLAEAGKPPLTRSEDA